MGARIRRVGYFHATVKDRPGEAFRLLAELAAGGVDLLAFSAVPLGHLSTQLVIFPADDEPLMRAAAKNGMVMTGPEHALLIQGDDELGALADIHRRLFDARVNVYASSGVTDGKGGYGYVVYVRPEDFEAAAGALGV